MVREGGVVLRSSQPQRSYKKARSSQRESGLKSRRGPWKKKIDQGGNPGEKYLGGILIYQKVKTGMSPKRRGVWYHAATPEISPRFKEIEVKENAPQLKERKTIGGRQAQDLYHF